MKKLKVTVEGLITTTFVGFDAEVEAFLTNIKKQQEALFDMKSYNKMMPKFTEKQLHINSSISYGKKYQNPSYELEKFREIAIPNGLKIKIEPFIDTNEFF